MSPPPLSEDHVFPLLHAHTILKKTKVYTIGKNFRTFSFAPLNSFPMIYTFLFCPIVDFL